MSSVTSCCEGFESGYYCCLEFCTMSVHLLSLGLLDIWHCVC